MNYQNRIVAFIDILGFKGVLEETVKKDGSDHEENINNVISAYETFVISGIWTKHLNTSNQAIPIQKE